MKNNIGELIGDIEKALGTLHKCENKLTKIAEEDFYSENPGKIQEGFDIIENLDRVSIMVSNLNISITRTMRYLYKMGYGRYPYFLHKPHYILRDIKIDEPLPYADPVANLKMPITPEEEKEFESVKEQAERLGYNLPPRK